ncbi:MAG TPA: GNAT family N-acetyltransferase [Usitatibacteraceae bacterium]
MDQVSSFTISPVSWIQLGEALSQVRFTVFVREQGVPPEFELDDLDADAARCLHVAATDDGGTVIATARLILDHPIPRIGRMAVLKAWRGHGVGAAMLEALCAEAKQRGFKEVMLHSQTHATPFYFKLGFLSHGSEFVEAAIPHLEMRRKL